MIFLCYRIVGFSGIFQIFFGAHALFGGPYHDSVDFSEK